MLLPLCKAARNTCSRYRLSSSTSSRKAGDVLNAPPRNSGIFCVARRTSNPANEDARGERHRTHGEHDTSRRAAQEAWQTWLLQLVPTMPPKRGTASHLGCRPAQRATAPPYRGMGHRTPAAHHSSVPQGLPGTLASPDTARLQRSLQAFATAPATGVFPGKGRSRRPHRVTWSEEADLVAAQRVLSPWQLSPGTTARFHALRHSGWRFSRKAQIPSRASSASAFSVITSIA